jgi:hypothetical protein
MVCFMRNWPAAFTGVTYPASGATTDYVSDLAPNTTYTISGAGAPASATTDTAGVLVFKAAGTGNITVGTVVNVGDAAKVEPSGRTETTALCVAAAAALAVSITLFRRTGKGDAATRSQTTRSNFVDSPPELNRNL